MSERRLLEILLFLHKAVNVHVLTKLEWEEYQRQRNDLETALRAARASQPVERKGER